MTNDKLDNLVKIGQLKAEPASEEGIAGLLRSGAGYRSESRYLVFQCTQHTLDLEPGQVRIA